MFSFNEMKKFIILAILAFFSLIGLFFATRTKDEWVCKNGTWVAQGNPKEVRPLKPCK